MSAIEKVKSIGMGIGGLIVILIVVAVPVILLFGMTWVSMKIFPWLMPVFLWTLAFCVVVLAPMALITKTRGFAAIGFLFSSYVFGAVLWVWALLLTYDLWGMFAVVVGILIAGIGIVPVALLAALFHADWSSLGDLAIMIVATFGIRFLSIWLAQKADREDQSIYG